MKTIKSNYHEPLVLALRDKKFGRFTTSQNLLPGATITVEENQISPECKALEKKRVITIEDLSAKDKESEDLAKLERELMSDNN